MPTLDDLRGALEHLANQALPSSDILIAAHSRRRRNHGKRAALVAAAAAAVAVLAALPLALAPMQDPDLAPAASPAGPPVVQSLHRRATSSR